MPNYKETTLVSTKYQRACRIIIENPLGKVPSVNFIEEEVTIHDDGTKSHKLVGSLNMVFDSNEIIEIIDPVSNEPIGKSFPVTIAQAIIYGLYWKKVKERDQSLSS